MEIAFYAPLKPPDHPVPSGDRRVARLLIAALGGAGHRVSLAARLRSRDGTGDPVRQARLAALGAQLAGRFLRAVGRGRRPRPDLWLTYHLYYKAPDWIGPAVAAALGIPYVLAEASHAPKRAGGPWDLGHRAAEAAIRDADLVVHLASHDRGCVAPLRPGRADLLLLPFLDPAPFAAARAARAAWRARLLPAGWYDGPVLLAVGMMRAGAKQRSYAELASALALLGDRPWRLAIVGDGPARDAVLAGFAPHGARVHHAGTAEPAVLAGWYAAADLVAWPAVDEAYGMALLEAQATGTPVVAGRVGGVPDIVRDGATGILVPPHDAPAFAAALAVLLDDAPRRRALGVAAAETVTRAHGIAAAGARLDAALRGLAGTGR